MYAFLLGTYLLKITYVFRFIFYRSYNLYVNIYYSVIYDNTEMEIVLNWQSLV